MRLIKRFPPLYARSKNGGVKLWMVRVFEDDGIGVIRTSHGYKGGKLQTTDRKVRFAKSTLTAVDQAAFEAASKWKKQTDKNYREDIDEIDNTALLPMLAHKYKKRKHKITWPVWVQPKLNGVRCIARRVGDTIKYASRGGKEYTSLEHLTPDLLRLMPDGAAFDGEVYIHGYSIQQLSGAVRRKHLKRHKPLSEPLQYHVYDIALPATTFIDRWARVRKLFTYANLKPGGLIREVQTFQVSTEDEMFEAHTSFVRNGYEGIILRNAQGLYLFDHRSNDLQKYKEFEDAEFTIVGGEEGQGKDEGTVIFTCTTNEGKTFNVRPRGSRELRSAWYKDLSVLIGLALTVRYQEKSDDGIPVFPVGICIRDYE